MGSYIRFGMTRRTPPTMTGSFNEKLLSSSYIAPAPMERFAVRTAVAKLSKKGREVSTSGRQLAVLRLIVNHMGFR